MSARHAEGFFPARDNLRLFFESDVPDAPRAHVGIVHGYMEHCGRYRKVVDKLVGDGFAVHTFDMRGHGQSDGRRAHCDAFEEFVDDLERFWNRVQAAAGGKKTVLLAHSHGSLVALHFLARRAPVVDAVVFSAPYLVLAVQASALRVAMGRLLAKVIPWLPLKEDLVPKLTRDVEVQKVARRDHLHGKTFTPGWYVESTRAQEEALRMGPSLKQPVLVLCGGEDRVASTADTRKFFDTIASADKTYKEYPGMLHEVLNELGKEQVWQDIAVWISKHL